MIVTTKAVAAILMTGLGSLAAGSAVYLEANPRAFIREHPAVPVVPPVHVERPLAPPSVSTVSVPETVTVDPVVITGRRRAPGVIAPTPTSVQAPCSEWQGLATGPAGRKVRMLCPH